MIEIRPGTKEDIPQIKKCLIDSWVEHAKQVPELLDEARMRSSDVDGYYQKCFDDPDRCFVSVAEEENIFAGFARADIQEIPPFFKNPKILYIDDVCVIPEFRRKGIAESLVRKIEELAKEKGIKRIQARVYTFNEPAQKLLQKLGFTMPHSTWDKVIE